MAPQWTQSIQHYFFLYMLLCCCGHCGTTTGALCKAAGEDVAHTVVAATPMMMSNRFAARALWWGGAVGGATGLAKRHTCAVLLCMSTCIACTRPDRTVSAAVPDIVPGQDTKVHHPCLQEQPPYIKKITVKHDRLSWQCTRCLHEEGGLGG